MMWTVILVTTHGVGAAFALLLAGRLVLKRSGSYHHRRATRLLELRKRLHAQGPIHKYFRTIGAAGTHESLMHELDREARASAILFARAGSWARDRASLRLGVSAVSYAVILFSLIAVGLTVGAEFSADLPVAGAHTAVAIALFVLGVCHLYRAHHARILWKQVADIDWVRRPESLLARITARILPSR